MIAGNWVRFSRSAPLPIRPPAIIEWPSPGQGANMACKVEGCSRGAFTRCASCDRQVCSDHAEDCEGCGRTFCLDCYRRHLREAPGEADAA